MVIDRVMAVGGSGAVTLKISATRAISEGQLVVVLGATVSPSMPARKSDERIRFIGDDGELSSRNPRQAELPGLRTVPQGEPETRDVAVGSPTARRI